MRDTDRLVRLTIVTPVFNDWTSFSRLLQDIEAEFAGTRTSVDVVAVNDGSSDAQPTELDLGGVVSRVDIVRLGSNVGHQRAIAVGLVQVATLGEADLVAVMDSDGEDRPQELARLVGLARVRPSLGYVAQRKKRSEGPLFRVCYRIYKTVFALLTGKRISFGNFSVLPIHHVKQIVCNTNVWNNFAAALIQSRLPIAYVPTVRGTRYAGTSKMNFVSLVTHGLGAISVFTEAVFIRILIASGALLAFAVLSSAAVLGIRIFSTLAVPGWATNVLGFALLLGVQSVMLPITLAFMILNNRASMQALPRDQALRLIDDIQSFVPDEDEAPVLPDRRAA